jgi:hypothetical protein
MGLISQVNVRDVVLILFRLLLFGEKKIIRKSARDNQKSAIPSS